MRTTTDGSDTIDNATSAPVVEWLLAASVSLALGFGAYHLHIGDIWICAVIVAPAFVWATGHTLVRIFRARAASQYGSWPTVVAAQCRAVATVSDYGRFLAFGHRLLRASQRGIELPASQLQQVPAQWLELLYRSGIIVPSSSGSNWRLADGIQSLDDVYRRVTETAFHRAIDDLRFLTYSDPRDLAD